LAAASQADTLIIGREGRLPWSAAQPRWTPPAHKARPVLAVYDDAASGRRALDTAAQLAQEGSDQVIVLVAATDPGIARRLARQALELLQQQGLRSAAYDRLIPDARAAAAAARSLRGKALLLGRDSSLLDEAAIETLINQLDCPVALV
jgi:hypothetical protein